MVLNLFSGMVTANSVTVFLTGSQVDAAVFSAAMKA
jgi:hypothetical protein